jgi:Ca2+-transporting ATPase
MFLFAAVMIIYFIAGRYVADPRQVQTYAFSAWIFGHITLAYISRTDRSALHTIGFFSNRIINLWALSAIVFLFAAIYLPVLNRATNLQEIPIMILLLIAAVVIAIISLLGIRKMLFKRGEAGGQDITE